MWSHGVMVSTLDSESSDPSSNLGGTCLSFFHPRSCKCDKSLSRKRKFNYINAANAPENNQSSNLDEWT